MTKPLTEEQIAEAKVAVDTYNTLKQDPTIQAYNARKFSRAHKWDEKRFKKAQRLRDLRKRAIQHKVILAATKGVTAAKDIAQELDVPVGRVRAVLTDKAFDRNLSNYQKGVLAAAREHIANKCIRAAEKVGELMENGKPYQRLQYEAAKDILDRCGLKPHEVSETITRNYSAQELESMLKVTKEVEVITERLCSTKSPFLLDKATKDKNEKESGG